jgi:hypothetical protein
MRFKLPSLLISLATLLALGMPALPANAAGASISLTASKSTVASGATVIIAIYVNGGGANVNAVQADLSYPASRLQYVGFSATGSAFEIAASNGGGDGTASLARGTLSPVNGSALLGTVTFRALVGSGSASIGVAGSSSLVSDGNPIPYGSSGVTVNFGVSAAGSSKATAAAPAPPKDTTPPVISAIKAKDVTPFSAAITWTTSEAADSVVEYGLDATYGLSASVGTATTVHSIGLNSAFLTPETVLHYRIKSTDAGGNVASSPDQTLQLPGVPVTIVVRGANGKPQAGVEVTLDGQTGTTDNKGRVTLASSLGNKKITTNYQGVTVQKPITVSRSTKPLPPIQLDLAKKPLNGWMLTSLGLMVVVITLLAIDAVLFGSQFLAKLSGLRFRRPHLALALGQLAAHRPAIHSIATAPTAPKPSSPPPLVPAKPEPKTELRLEPLSEPEPAIDINKTVSELMGEATPPPVALTAPNAAPPAPIKISLEPLPSSAPKAPTVKAVPVTEVPTSPAADVAQRLKKPAVKKSAAKKPTTKKSTAAQKRSAKAKTTP